jgi:hypothetical protein
MPCPFAAPADSITPVPCRAGDTKVAQQIALSLKVLPQLLEAMPTDRLTEDGFLPTLQAAHLLVLDKEGEFGGGSVCVTLSWLGP